MKITYQDGRPDEVVEEEHFLVRFEINNWPDHNCEITFDLTEMCKSVGKKCEWYDDWETLCNSVTFSTAMFKKALKQIRRYGEPETIEATQKWLDEHFPKWGQTFSKLTG